MAWASLSPSNISQESPWGPSPMGNTQRGNSFRWTGQEDPFQSHRSRKSDSPETDSAREVEMQGLSGIISERGKQGGAKGEAEL